MRNQEEAQQRETYGTGKARPKAPPSATGGTQGSKRPWVTGGARRQETPPEGGNRRRVGGQWGRGPGLPSSLLAGDNPRAGAGEGGSADPPREGPELAELPSVVGRFCRLAALP